MSSTEPRYRVLALTDTMTAGGSGRFIALLLEHLDRERFEVDLAKVFETVPLYEIPDDVRVHELANEPAVEPPVDLGISEAELANMGEVVPWLQSIIDRVAHLVSRLEPDIVYCAPEWVSVAAAAASARFPEPTQLVCRIGVPASVAFPDEGRTRLHAALLRLRFNKAASVVAISDEIARELRGIFSVDPNLITLFHNPIDVASVQRRATEPVTEVDFDDGIPSLVFVGRLERVKGLDGLLRAVAALNAGSPLRCVLVGDGSQRGYLQALAKHLGIDEIVEFVGAQSNPFRFVSKGTVFVLPSFDEGLGSVILEAMACGTPVVATDIAGGITRYVLADGECGLLVPVGDTQALTAAIRRLLDDPDLRTRISQNALRRVAEFDVHTAMREHEALLERLGERARSLRAGVPILENGRGRPDAASTVGPRAAAAAASSGAAPDASEGPPAPTEPSPRPSRSGSSRPRSGRRAHSRRNAERAVAGSGSRKTRVLIVVPDLAYTATDVGTRTLLRGLDRETFELLLVPIFDGQETQSLPDDVERCRLPAPGRAVRKRLQVERSLRERYPDETSWLVQIAGGIAKLAAIERVDALVGQGFLATGAVLLSSRALPEGTAVLGSIREYARQFAEDPQLAIYQYLLGTRLAQADAVFAPSDEIRGSLIDAFGIASDRALVVLDPILAHEQYLGAFVPISASSADQAAPWVFVCVLEPEFSSGGMELAEALSAVRSQEDARCIVIGHSASGALLVEAARRHGVDDAIDLVADPRDLTHETPSVVAYVCPCADLAGLIPDALTEAIGRRLPVVATDAVPAAVKLLKGGEGGVVVRRGDPLALAEAMLQLIWDVDVRERIVDHATAALASQSRDYVELYERTISRALNPAGELED